MILDVSQLRALRQRRGWDVPEMARQLRLAAGSAAIPSHDGLARMIRRWEAGSNGMSERYQLLCRRAFGLSDPPAAVSAPTVSVETLPAIIEEDTQVQRREFLTTSVVVAGSLATPPQLAYLSAGRRISADVPETLLQRLVRLRRLDNYLGGSETYHLYAGELEATRTLVRETTCTQATQKRLLAVVSEQAQQAGWAAFDAGWQATARTLYQESLDAGHMADDRALEGNALALLAYQNLTMGEPAASFADASCDAAGTGTPPKVRALLHERRAWALAHTGDSRAVGQALDRAVTALQESDNGHTPDWAVWVDHIELQIMTGRCLTKIGQPRDAIPVLHQALGQFDDAQARDKALYMSWLAEAYLDAGEIDAAAGTAGQVLTLAEGVASVRPMERLRPILGRLSLHSASASVAALLDRASGSTPWT